MKDFSKLCTPARIYFAIAVVATVIELFYGFPIMAAFWRLLFAFIWTFVLGWLCDKGYKSLSWFLVLLPYIIIILAMSNIYHVTPEQKQIMRTIKLQGAYGQEPMELMQGGILQEGMYFKNQSTSKNPTSSKKIQQKIKKVLRKQNPYYIEDEYEEVME
jgi:hypothetical protein